MRKLLDRFYTGCGIISGVSIAFIMAIIATQVFLNLIDAAAAALGLAGLGFMIPSYATFSGYGLACATFLALGPAIRSGAHIRVTLIQERLPKALQRPVLVLIGLCGTLVGMLITYSLASLAYESWDFGDKSSGLVAVPLWIPQTMLTIGALGFLIACADTFIEVLRFGHSASFNELKPEETTV